MYVVCMRPWFDRRDDPYGSHTTNTYEYFLLVCVGSITAVVTQEHSLSAITVHNKPLLMS